MKYHQISKLQLEYNLGDDAETTKALTALHELLKTEPLAKTFLLTDFGALERYLLSHLQSLDEQIMLLSCQCLYEVITGKVDAASLVVKRQGLQILKVCAMDEAKDIRVSSLENVRVLTQNKRVQAVALEIGLVDVCQSYVAEFSIEELDDELVDLGVFCAAIDVLSHIAES